MSLIQVESLKKYYNNSGTLAVKDISFTVDKGEFVSIVGPFGCGKTTVLHLIGGITDDYQGLIKVDGDMPSVARIKRKVGYSFQKPNLLPWLNVLENVLLPQRIANVKEDKKRAIELLKMVDLEKCSSMKTYNLSGGMQQLVSITRALILDPQILLLDEPLSSIDEINRSKIQFRLLGIHKMTRKTTLMITHSISEAVILSDKVVVLTSRPSVVKKIVDIDLPKRDEKTIFSKKFTDYVKAIRTEMKNGQTN